MVKTLPVSDEVHKDLKEFCNKKGLKMIRVVDQAIREWLKKQKVG